MTTTSYLIAWFIYLMAAYGFCAVFWIISRHWPSLMLRYSSRSALIVLLCTPYFSDASQNRLAPALLISLFEAVFGDKSIALSAATPLALLLILATIVSLVLALRHKKSSSVHTTVCIGMMAMALTYTLPVKINAEELAAFTPPELASGNLVCHAQWNQLCDEEKTLTVPEGNILCQHHVTVTHQEGKSSYEITKVEKNGITVKFNAKGNQDRFKQQGADIALQVSLLGVPEGRDCSKKPEPHVIVIEKKLPTIILPAEPVKIEPPVVVSHTTELPKVHACACSQWNESKVVETCLVQGTGPKNKTCDSYHVKIECVADRASCALLQRKTCQATIELDPAQSFKRLFVADSLYCSPSPPTAP